MIQYQATLTCDGPACSLVEDCTASAPVTLKTTVNSYYPRFQTPVGWANWADLFFCAECTKKWNEKHSVNEALKPKEAT